MSEIKHDLAQMISHTEKLMREDKHVLALVLASLVQMGALPNEFINERIKANRIINQNQLSSIFNENRKNQFNKLPDQYSIAGDVDSPL